MEWAPNVAQYSWEYFLYYGTVFITVSYFGPLSGLLLFAIPTLRKDDMNVLWRK